MASTKCTMGSFIELHRLTLSPTFTSMMTALRPDSLTIPTSPLNLLCGMPFTWVESILITTFCSGTYSLRRWLRPCEALFLRRDLVLRRYPFDLAMEEPLPSLHPHLKRNP